MTGRLVAVYLALIFLVSPIIGGVFWGHAGAAAGMVAGIVLVGAAFAAWEYRYPPTI